MNQGEKNRYCPPRHSIAARRHDQNTSRFTSCSNEFVPGILATPNCRCQCFIAALLRPQKSGDKSPHSKPPVAKLIHDSFGGVLPHASLRRHTSPPTTAP